MYHLCTITTADHLYKTFALYDSIRAVHADSVLNVLCIDTLPALEPDEHMAFYSLADMSAQPTAQNILTKYRDSPDKLRWCMKPVFLRYLLDKGLDKVIYTDNDIYFYGDYEFLFELLDSHSFLLTPHHYPRDPARDQNWLEANFKVGLYNAGFVGVNKNAIASLKWWADCCAYRCEKNPLRGTFDDQKYLDLIPVMEETAHVVRHKGCNVAEWNSKVISRSKRNGKVVLDSKYPLVFVHYNGTTVRAINEGREPCLNASFDAYITTLRKYNGKITAAELQNKISTLDNIKLAIWKGATRLGF